MADPAGLGRGPLTRRFPVLLLDPPEPRDAAPFHVGADERPGRFVARIVFALPRVTVPAMLLAIVWQVGESAVPVVMGLAIDRALTTGDAGQLALWLGVLVAVYAALTLSARLSLRLTAYATQVLQHRLRATLSAGVLHPVGGSVRAPDGGVVSLMTTDVLRLANAVILMIIPISRVTAIGFIAVSLLAMHWLLGLVVVVGAPVAVWLMGVLSERLARDTREYQELLASTVGQATDLVAGYRVIKGVRAEAEATARYVRASRQTLLGAQRNAGVLGRFLVGSGMVNGAFVAGVTGLAGWFAVEGRLTPGELIAAIGLTQALLPQMQWIASASIPNLAGSRAASARILVALRERVPAAAGSQAPDPQGLAPLPALEVVLSERGGGGAALRVEKGEMVGLRVDDRTAARVVESLLDPAGDSTAAVHLDGVAARGLHPSLFRARVAVAPHRVTLFSGTIAENVAVALGPGSSDPGRLEAALHAAACDDFVTDLDASVGESGSRLSGGQRQRVALARALASDAPILVLHDPTTAVDSITEGLIAERMRSLREGRSTVLVTSSPALLAVCDRVVEL